jgi:hypothetical protein
MAMTVISNEPQHAIPELHIMPAMMATGEPVHFYDKDARPVHCSESVWPAADQENVWVRGEVIESSSSGMQMAGMLSQGRVLAISEDKGLVFQQKDDGNIIFYSFIPSGLSLTKVSSVEDLRQMLKTAFAGWHHAYHEVFAMAKSFSYFLANKLKPETSQLAH